MMQRRCGGDDRIDYRRRRRGRDGAQGAGERVCEARELCSPLVDEYEFCS
jgi:hypothetical protein